MKDEKKQTSNTMNLSDKKKTEDDTLERDKPGPVSVSPEGKDKHSYTHNADKSDPVDPHLSDENPPGSSSSPQNTEDDALDRDKSGQISVSPEGKGKPSYTHNADKSDPIDPHLADLSEHSKKKDEGEK